MYPEAELLLVSWLADRFPPARVGTETPAKLGDYLPYIKVTREGGTADTIWSYDNPVMDFEVYAADRASARSLAEEVWLAIRSELPGTTATYTDGEQTARGFVERARDVVKPLWTPYDNTSVRRFVCTTELRIRALDV